MKTVALTDCSKTSIPDIYGNWYERIPSDYCIPGRFFHVTADKVIRNIVDESLSKIVGGVAQLYKKSRGRDRMDLDKRVRKFHVYEGETMSSGELHEQIRSIQDIQDELKEWKEKYINLEEEKETMYNEMAKTLEEKEQVIDNLMKNNKELEDYVENLSKAVGISSYHGKPVSEAKKKNRTLKTFLSKAKMALWFASSTGKIHDVKCHQHVPNLEPTTSTDQSGETSTFSSLPLEEKNMVEQILFLLDKFCVGDNFYHELSMIVNGLPRSYLVKQCRHDLNDMCHLEGLKGKFPGTKVSSVKNLFVAHILDYLSKNPGFQADTDIIQIKISGDGAKMTNYSNFILLSFAILQTGESVMSAKGNRTIGVVNWKEDYSTIKEAFTYIIDELNQLIADGKLNVEGKDINIEFFLGGNYKFILMMLGLKGAISKYACAWCKILKDERWKMDQHYSYYNEPTPIKISGRNYGYEQEIYR